MKKYAVIMLVLMATACGKAAFEPVDEGVEYQRLFDTKRFILNQLQFHKENESTYAELTNKEGKLNSFDTANVRATLINWANYTQPLLDINLCDSNYNKVYRVDLKIDSTLQRIEALYLPLYNNLPVTKMLLSFDMDEELMGIYAEYSKLGFWTDIKRTITYKRNEVLQIQETTNSIFSAPKTTIRKLLFNAGQEATPKVKLEAAP
jgi:hypothetical protein